MGDGLNADIARIQECADSFHRIHREFSEAANPMDGQDRATIGSSELLDTFETFESNWKIRRGELTDALEKLGGITEMAAQSYSEVNRALVDALRENDA
ncbi:MULTISPECIES: hypothetical protein [Streptomyces]|uniref:hypothetical protein n=1 Tax=Streptomyces TaxID=1883 RepID=UPI000CD53791|nr:MULTISPECIES: hypothetical protein [Streptomyces]